MQAQYMLVCYYLVGAGGRNDGHIKIDVILAAAGKQISEPKPCDVTTPARIHYIGFIVTMVIVQKGCSE